MSNPVTWESNLPTIVDEVCDGCMQVLDYLNSGVMNTSMADVMHAGNLGRAEAAHTWIFEFIKDGITPAALKDRLEHPDEMRAHHRITTAAYLKNFGIEDA